MAVNPNQHPEFAKPFYRICVTQHAIAFNPLQIL